LVVQVMRKNFPAKQIGRRQVDGENEEMGTFNVTVILPKACKINALVDTGATFSKFAAKDLRKLNIRPSFSTTVELADGRKIKRKVGYVKVKLASKSAPVPVMFGKNNERALIGATTLEILGLVPEPRKKILVESVHLEQ